MCENVLKNKGRHKYGVPINSTNFSFLQVIEPLSQYLHLYTFGFWTPTKQSNTEQNAFCLFVVVIPKQLYSHQRKEYTFGEQSSKF